MSFSTLDFITIGLIFIWTGFVRTGIGFGGSALGLPLLLIVRPDPLLWLPIIGIHLLFFSSLTLSSRLAQVDWSYLGTSLFWIMPTTLLGVLGLLSMPNDVLVFFIYTISLLYGIYWLCNGKITSHSPLLDKGLLLLGGYAAGTALTGAPLIVAVFIQHVKKQQLRATLFVMWMILVTTKMTTFITFGVDIAWQAAILLLPIAGIGHYFGLKLYDKLLENTLLFRRVIGTVLIVISAFSLLRYLF